MIPSSSRTTLKYLDNSFTQVHLLILPSDWITWSSGLLIAESIHSSRIIDRSGLFLVNSKYWVVFIRNSKLVQTHPINNLKCNPIKIHLLCHCRKCPTLPTREPTVPCKQTKLSPKHSNSPPLSMRGESRARDAAIHRVSGRRTTCLFAYWFTVDRHGFSALAMTMWWSDEMYKSRPHVIARREHSELTRQSPGSNGRVQTMDSLSRSSVNLEIMSYLRHRYFT